MTSDAWADDGLRNGVLDLIDQGRINAVELDLKEEGGKIGWNAPVPLAHKIGAVQRDDEPRATPSARCTTRACA